MLCCNFDKKIAQPPSFLHVVCQYSTTIAKVGKKESTTVWMTTKQMLVCHTSQKSCITRWHSYLRHCSMRYKQGGRGFDSRCVHKSLWPRSRISLIRVCVGLTTLPSSCVDCPEILGAPTPRSPNGLSMDSFTFTSIWRVVRRHKSRSFIL
jgi:hypothetical protein